jgi:hypothetical protein
MPGYFIEIGLQNPFPNSYLPIILIIYYQGYQEKLFFATTVQGVYFILYLDRHMFRPSLAIIGWNTLYII